MKKYDFMKLVNARQKAHLKSLDCLDVEDRLGFVKYQNVVDNLTEIISDLIDNC